MNIDIVYYEEWASHGIAGVWGLGKLVSGAHTMDIDWVRSSFVYSMYKQQITPPSRASLCVDISRLRGDSRVCGISELSDLGNDLKVKIPQMNASIYFAISFQSLE
jgi:hypothetical protein